MVELDISILKARAAAMRRTGASMAEISKAVGRCVSTLHRWAAADGWRLEEIEEEVFPPPFTGEVANASEAEGGMDSAAPLAATRHSPRARGEKDIMQPDLTPLDAAKALQQRAAALGAAGEIRAAEAAARLADRILRTEYWLGRVKPADTPPPTEAEIQALRAEIGHRLDRLRGVQAEAREAAMDTPWRRDG